MYVHCRMKHYLILIDCYMKYALLINPVNVGAVLLQQYSDCYINKHGDLGSPYNSWKARHAWGCRAVSAVNSTCCSFRGLGFGFQHLHRSQKPSVILGPEVLMTFSVIRGHQACSCTDTPSGETWRKLKIKADCASKVAQTVKVFSAKPEDLSLMLDVEGKNCRFLWLQLAHLDTGIPRGREKQRERDLGLSIGMTVHICYSSPGLRVKRQVDSWNLLFSWSTQSSKHG